jgi:hypothetical protein
MLQVIVDLVELGLLTMRTEMERSIVTALARMAEFHSGEELARTADSLVRRLPPGRIVLVSTTIEGAAIAAVMSALSAAQDVSWYLISPNRRAKLPEGHVVLIEPVDAGEGWRRTMESMIPGAEIFIAST